MHDCFISYSHSDSEVAIAIQNILEQNDIKCWIDFRDAVPGIEYAASIVQAIKTSRYFILVLSGNSSKSVHVMNEINSAVNAGAKIIPFKIDDCALNDSLEYYLGKTHWLDATTKEPAQHFNQLISLISSYNDSSVIEILPCKMPVAIKHHSQAFNTPTSNECRMLKFEDLLSLGYTSESISLQLVENDYINCNGIGMKNEGTPQQWEEYLQNNSETFQYLVSPDNKIVGDWSIVALNEESFAAAIKGELLEADFDIDKTELICFPGEYYGYILTFSLLPTYRNMKNYNLIVESFLSQLEEYAINGIFFKSWCMNVFGKEVESLIKQLGFKFTTNNKVCGKIYCCDFMPLPDLPIYKKHSELIKRYNNANT